jgi:adenine-specific DNA-methyltransferase
MAKPGKKLNRAILNGTEQAGLLFAGTEHGHERPTLPESFEPHRPEESYRNMVDAAHRRRFGQYFTPPPIAELMVTWIAGCNPKEILDPAVGPGIFVREAIRRLAGARATALDIDPVALEAARQSIQADADVEFIQGDFMTWKPEARFDAILANPPYLKHHNFHYEHDIFTEIGCRSGVRLSRLSNIYVLFIMEICRRLRSGGRAAIIVPGEWVNANYGDALKEYLLGNRLLKVLIYFSHSALIFDEALGVAPGGAGRLSGPRLGVPLCRGP